jgi:hypothetical protein
MNFPAQSKIKMYGPSYRHANGVPNNAWSAKPIAQAGEGPELVRKVIEKISAPRP